ncbi:heterogeneous nuclear ribonucleoprotein A/B isoform X2 [Amborella trichopoda]|uniref:heterogeneous nuclear ribonucleoprotein A/B isoform X2 n=1 Tax=Amborella trichopoda TaxID=13333 RepID=UPI0009C0489C|nr:heterogeneous nuclear ribonucleoprotein A/B isoform X2 [Amborella trichopoda]XP_020517480.1 heterogeneous nuclear ribonucleoprotein A/B isoform X2 [Amborella trichopoda]|eukprot:XP_020517478.1 heterogeneous nuclear ribonucleoprotein A/B isoform X2 [Amborella trichopoda]
MLLGCILGSQNLLNAEEIRDTASADLVHRKIHVRMLAMETTSKTLCDVFRVHGEIEDGCVFVDRPTGQSLRYGFVIYRDMKSAQRALKEPCKLIDGQLIMCYRSDESLTDTFASSDQEERRVFIGGFSPHVSRQMLINSFSKYGPIHGGFVAYDKDTNTSRGFGFIEFKTEKAAKKALDDPNKVLEGRRITVKLAYRSNTKDPTELEALAHSEQNRDPTQLPPPFVYPMPNPFPVAFPFQVGQVKLNFDGICLGNSVRCGVGGVLSNEYGQTLLAFSGPCESGDSNTVEARALLSGLQMAISRSFYLPLFIESDSINVIKWACGELPLPLNLRINDIMGQVQEIFKSVHAVFFHVSIESNALANALARAGAMREILAFGADPYSLL